MWQACWRYILVSFRLKHLEAHLLKSLRYHCSHFLLQCSKVVSLSILVLIFQQDVAWPHWSKHNVLVIFLSLWQNTWENQLKRKIDLFWLTFQRFFFMAISPCCFWAYDGTAHHGMECIVEETAYLMTSWRQRERGERLESTCPLQGHTPVT
jgi:hypothetical protein